MSLEDEKAKKIANVLSNKSCSKILEYLTENEATESEIAVKLNLPISTVHYNLKQLLEAKLITWEKYHYSEKGKEVRHYTVANKYIIITPKGDNSGILDKLKTLIPTFLLVGIGAGVINWFQNFRYLMTFETNAVMADSLARGGEMPLMAAKAVDIEMIYEEPSWYENFFQNIIYENWFWFLIGAISGILIYLIVRWIRKKLNKN